MDTSSIMKAIMNEDTLKNISKSVGISEKDIKKIASGALPELLNGAAKQHKNQDTAASFMKAVMAHGDKDSDDISKFIKNIDLDDGAKIVGHLLGTDKSTKAKAVANKTGASDKDTENVMAMLAPMVMNQLGKSAKKSSKKNETAVGDILGSIVKGVDADDVMKIAKSFLK